MKITREGVKFLLLTALMAVASANTGNNLLTLILGMLLAIAAVSLAASVINLRGLELSVSVEGPVYARGRGTVEVEVRNLKQRADSYSIRVGFPEGLEGEASVPHVPAGGTAAVSAHVGFGRRGVYRYEGFTLESGFPFIFLKRRVRARALAEVVVYPEIIDVEPVLGSAADGGRGAYTIRAGGGEEMLGLREHRAGEDVRRVSWRASAKAGRLMVREYAEETPRLATVVLDDRPPFDGEGFERAVSAAASLARALLAEDYYVKLVTCRKVLPAGAGLEHMHRVMYLLATAAETADAGCLVDEEAKGYTFLVVKGRGSSLAGAGPELGMVVDASRL